MIDFNLGKIGADVVLEKGQWDKGIASLSQDEQRAAGVFQSIENNALAVTAAMAAAGAAMLKTIKAGIDSFVKYEDAFDTFNIVFGKYKEESLRFADTLSDESRRSKTEIMGMMGEFQTMLMGMGLARKDAIGFAQEFAQMSTDLASFWNRPLDEGVFAFQSALYGRTLSLRRMGLAVTDAMLKEKALSMGYRDAKGDATQLGKAIATLTLAKERLSFVQGNAERSAFMFKEIQNDLRKQIGAVSTEIGRHIAGFLKPYYEMLTKILKAVKDLMKEYPGFAKVMSLGIGGGAVLTTAAAGKGALGWLSQFGGGAAMGAGAVAGGNLMASAVGAKEAIAKAVADGVGYAAAKGMVEKIGRPATQWIRPEVIPPGFPSQAERMAAFWRLNPRSALGGAGVPLLEGPTTALAVRASVVRAAGTPAVAGATSAFMAALGRMKDGMSSVGAFFTTKMTALHAALAPIIALAKPLLAASAALYGILKLSDALALPEVKKMLGEAKEGIKGFGDSVVKFLDDNSLGLLASAVVKTAQTVSDAGDFIRAPWKKAVQVAEFAGTAATDESGRFPWAQFAMGGPAAGGYALMKNLRGNWDEGILRMEQEKQRQDTEAMWTKMREATKDSMGELGEATSEFIDGVTAEIKGIKINYRPELALFSDFVEQFKEVLKTEDPLVMQGFAQEIQDAYRELDGDMQARFRLKVRQYDEALKPEESFYLSEVMKTVERLDLEKEQEAAQELFRAAFEAAKEGARKAAGVTDAVKQLVETIIERVKKTREEFKDKINGLIQNIGDTWSEMRDAQNMVADYEWAKYDRQMQVGEARETTGGGMIASALNRALGAVATPTSMSPQERELQSIRDAQFRSVELQGRLVMLQEQLNFLLSGGGGIMQMAKL